MRAIFLPKYLKIEFSNNRLQIIESTNIYWKMIAMYLGTDVQPSGLFYDVPELRKISALQRDQILIPGTCECVLLHTRYNYIYETCGVIRPGVLRWALSYSMSSYKRELSPSGAGRLSIWEHQRDRRQERDLFLSLTRESWAKEFGCPLEAKSNSHPKSSKEMRISLLCPPENHFCQQSEQAWRRRSISHPMWISALQVYAAW